ncbi:hypothetical protein KCH_23750 [Kitasatospora cheerisanensis KCTC 2395]|uniref:Uncharacterized protein n=1 Tax=Kitasatospora cheerisanensis KCTC 2395 TaxID=1348663 RepID=A0A066Z0T7_9ACTN|nr:hypothetical protein KCH_23750 [Kitasatospora cheerisanensis KCTC 2395]
MRLHSPYLNHVPSERVQGPEHAGESASSNHPAGNSRSVPFHDKE